MQIMGLIVSGDLDSKKAGHLLYALQIASSNLRHTRYVSFKDYVVDPAETRNYVLDKFDSWKNQVPEDIQQEAETVELQGVGEDPPLDKKAFQRMVLRMLLDSLPPGHQVS